MVCQSYLLVTLSLNAIFSGESERVGDGQTYSPPLQLLHLTVQHLWDHSLGSLLHRNVSSRADAFQSQVRVWKCLRPRKEVIFCVVVFFYRTSSTDQSFLSFSIVEDDISIILNHQNIARYAILRNCFEQVVETNGREVSGTNGSECLVSLKKKSLV